MSIVTDGLVLYLHGACGKNNPATRVWKDLSGNGNDGKLRNFGYTEDSGWVDGGLRFDGVDDYVEVADSESLNPDFITLEIVLMPTNDWYVNKGLFSKGLSSQRQYWAWESSSGQIAWQINNAPFFKSTHVHTLGEVVHHVLTYNGVMAKVYTNGVLDVAQEQSNESLIKTNTTLSLGNMLHFGSSTEYFNGNILVFRIYNRALTDEEIMQNYRAGHEWTPQIGKREVTSIVKPIASSLSRKGTGKRELITTVKPITTSLERTSISKKLPPIHAEISTKERNPSITTRERIPKLEVD